MAWVTTRHLPLWQSLSAADHLVVPPETTRALSVATARPIRVGAWARVELAGGDVWAGRVSYVSGELVGLKAATIVDGRVAEGDTVTLVIGKGESMVAAQARVLSASGSFMRLSRRESSEGLERRRALRVPVEQRVSVTVTDPAGGGVRDLDAELTDMSASGCALRAASHLPVGDLVSVSLRIVGTDLTVTGKVVRAWRSDETWGEHAGIQFDPLPAATTNLINRYLVEQLRETSNPRQNCGRRSPATS
jgi:PilZ domain